MGSKAPDSKPGRSRSGLAMSILSTISLGAVVVLGSRSTRTTDLDGLPEVGTAWRADILPAREGAKFRTVIFVSDGCALCRQRASSYMAHLRRKDATLLVVGASEHEPVFGALADRHPALRDRIVFVPDREFSARTGVRPVPSYVRLNDALVVTKAGMSNVGWMRSVLDPRHWLRSWKRLLGG